MNIYLAKNDYHSTLCTWLYCHFAQAYAAETYGHKYYFHWPRFGSVQSYDDPAMFQQVPNQFEWYFIQPCGKLESKDQTWMWETPLWGTDAKYSQTNLWSQPLSVIRDVFKRNLIFNEAVNARGNELIAKYNIDPAKTIGVTWRGTDIYLESLNGNKGRPYLPIETYFPFIDDILNANPDFRIVCTAEETQILDPLINRYNATLIEEFEQAPVGSKNNPERFSKRSGFERGLQPVLMVWLFSKFAHYVKNRASTSCTASFISDGRIVSLGHREDFGFFDGGNPYAPIAEINGVQYPLYR